MGLQMGAVCCRSDPTASSAFHGMDAPTKLAEDAAGEKVVVTFIPAGRLAQNGAQAPAAAAEPSGRHDPPREDGDAGKERSGERRRSRSKNRGRDGDGQRRRSRERSRSRERGRHRRRSTSAERRHKRDREKDRVDRDQPTKRHSSEEARKKQGEERKDAAETEAQPPEPAPVVLETSKEGKVHHHIRLS